MSKAKIQTNLLGAKVTCYPKERFSTFGDSSLPSRSDILNDKKGEIVGVWVDDGTWCLVLIEADGSLHDVPATALRVHLVRPRG